MSIRKVRALLMGPLLILSLLVVPFVRPAAASPAGPASVCAIAGTVFVDATAQLPPGASTPGTYSFNNVLIVCVGGLTGVSNSTTSSGSTGPACGPAFPVPGTFGQFCGGYNAQFNNGATSCDGQVGGPGLFNTLNPTAPWSLTFGNVIVGSINCSDSTAGVIALLATPTSINIDGVGNPVPDGTTPGILGMDRDCPNSGPASLPVVGQLPPDADAKAWACSIFVAGVAVIVG